MPIISSGAKNHNSFMARISNQKSIHSNAGHLFKNSLKRDLFFYSKWKTFVIQKFSVVQIFLVNIGNQFTDETIRIHLHESIGKL